MDPQKHIPLLVVAGPTASGKSALAVALARELDGEVVSADSMQVYAEPRIGTARPTPEEMGGVPHHLLGFLPLSVPYSAAQYAQDAHGVIREIRQRGRLPILCGGTGLYIRAVVENWQFPRQPASREQRKALRERAAREGGESMLSELRRVDPETAARLHPHDTGRILRALEATMAAGVPMSEQQRQSRREPSPYDVVMLTLDFHDRELLYGRIDRRADGMLSRGLVEEARRILQNPEAPTALQAIGYKEFAPYFAGEIPLEEAIENLKRGTRRYAKRQLSWFRHVRDARVLYVDDYESADGLLQAALRVIEERGQTA